ncbi:MAG TPA: CapA family protein [Casimicrobiaceae bacterium]|nr:CapA family protein [Casimicrobiaceae bacterium]
MRLVACGDALYSSRNLVRRLDSRITTELLQADAAFANAEFCTPRRGTPPAPRRFTTAVDPEVLDELAALNIRLVSFANNHTGDFGPQGVIDTIDAAHARGLLSGGIGHSLYEARAARFLDTPEGRIGFVAASATRAADFTASAPGAGVPARPGLNPLRFGRAYVLPAREFEELKRIDELLGTARSRREVASVEVMKDTGPDKFSFGSVFEGSLPIERGDRAHVRYFMNEQDCQAILANIRDAANRADYVLMSLHTHEGVDENWYHPRAASFVEDFARRAIEAGATAFVAHGAHMLRGIEIYRGRPIFYNLGSLFMEFEAGEQRMTPEMYEGFGFGGDALPSQMHMSRVSDASGKRIGFYGDRKFSLGCMARCDLGRDAVQVKLVPIDLDLNRDRPAERGLPYVPSPEGAREIMQHMARLSEFYGTRLSYSESDGTIAVAMG